MLLTSQSHHTGIEIEKNVCAYYFIVTLNRTTLELKLFSSWTIPDSGLTLNRTTLKLKCALSSPSPGIRSTLNRTTLELKFRRHPRSFVYRLLSIAPHWNWNEEEEPRTVSSINSQSHHTGIEIRWRQRILCSCPRSQSHHTGIEI